jgi:hypothetical protein
VRRAGLVTIALVTALALGACCSMSRRPIPGICAVEVARVVVSAA